MPLLIFSVNTPEDKFKNIDVFFCNISQNKKSKFKQVHKKPYNR